jgi:hypothetical protein
VPRTAPPVVLTTVLTVVSMSFLRRWGHPSPARLADAVGPDIRATP